MNADSFIIYFQAGPWQEGVFRPTFALPNDGKAIENGEINHSPSVTYNLTRCRLLADPRNSQKNKFQRSLDIGKTSCYLCTPKHGEQVEDKAANKLVVS
jgi:hypothetical protein